jgi:hypothetical protein
LMDWLCFNIWRKFYHNRNRNQNMSTRPGSPARIPSTRPQGTCFKSPRCRGTRGRRWRCATERRGTSRLGRAWRCERVQVGRFAPSNDVDFHYVVMYTLSWPSCSISSPLYSSMHRKYCLNTRL